MRQICISTSVSREGGSSYFEFMIAAIVISLLSGLLLHRFVTYQRQVEEAGVQQFVAALRVALQVKRGKLLTTGQDSQVALLADTNPIELLSEKPHNYRGDYFSPDPGELPGGIWFFERNSKTLVYLLNNGKSFPGGIPKALKFKVKLSHSPQINVEPQSRPSVTNVSLVQVDR